MSSKAARIEDHLTVSELAVKARCKPVTVRRAIKAGRLRAFRPAGKDIIKVTDAVAWIEARPSVGQREPFLGR